MTVRIKSIYEDASLVKINCLYLLAINESVCCGSAFIVLTELRDMLNISGVITGII